MPIIKLITEYEQLKIYEFEIELENNESLKLHFEEKNLKHLMGIHQIKPLEKHSGDKIYNDLKSGKFTIINDSNISLNSKIFKNKNVVEKLINFSYIKSYLFKPVISGQDIIEFNKLEVSLTCQQGSDYLLHFEYEEMWC